MRVVAQVPLPSGAFPPGHRFDVAQLPAVRDPSLTQPVGRVAWIGYGPTGDTLEVHLDLDEKVVTGRLRERRPIF